VTRGNVASIRVGFAVAVVTLVFWSVWSLFVPVPSMGEIQLTQNHVFNPPHWQIFGLSIWSRWFDPLFAGIAAFGLVQVLQRSESERLFSGLCFGLLMGLLFSLGTAVGSEAGGGVVLLVLCLIFSLFNSPAFGLGFGLGFGLSCWLYVGPCFSVVITLSAVLTVALVYVLLAAMRAFCSMRIWSPIGKWLCAED